MPARKTAPPYKNVTLQQLRSFYETARLGSMAAAADSLGLTHPTVWTQVHALEREFEIKLIEPYRRGCRLTDAGKSLLELIGPAVTSLSDLKRRFNEATEQVETRLMVASTPRPLVEDLPDVAVAFRKQHPDIRLVVTEIVSNEEIVAAVEAGEQDIGLVTGFHSAPASPCALFEVCYELDMLLITPKDHPLARQRTVTPRDLQGYPLVNALKSITDKALAENLEKLGLFQLPEKTIEAYYSATIRRYVEKGLGIGLIGGFPRAELWPDLHVRLMTRYFGRIPIYFCWRRKPEPDEPGGKFVKMVARMLGRTKGRQSRS